jgi:hypothetical protein
MRSSLQGRSGVGGVVLFYSERHLYHSGGRGEEIEVLRPPCG